VKTGLVLVAVLALAGCETTTGGTTDSPDRTIANISPEAQAAMEARGLPLSTLFRGENGCYAIEVEVTNPRSGAALKRVDGTPICDKA
jgi:hypothetical protein